MGLDMYLSGKRYLSKYHDDNDSDKINTINEIFGIDGDEEKDYCAEEIKFRLAYWRKANPIHKWFVENCQNGVDECQETWVARDKLVELLDVCRTVIADMSKAEELLPTQSGFFFGSSDYDEWYQRDLEYTVGRLEKILEDSALDNVDFYYQSSW
jgi:hypothetical protein